MNLPLPLRPHRDILKSIWNLTTSDNQIYIVGGAVRDTFLKKTTHDLDFTLASNAIEICRQVANKINGAFYVLDENRKTARIILTKEDNSRQHIDFSTFRGNSIEEDLHCRDFTINAMALPVSNLERLIDPLAGLKDLQERRLRACSGDSIVEDPVRILRAVRLSGAYSLFIEPDTKKLITGSIKKLSEVSPERIRDEIFRILDSPKPATAMAILDKLGALDWILPGIQFFQPDLGASPEEVKGFNSRFSTLEQLKNILQVLSIVYDPETAMNLVYGYLSVRLGRYRQKLHYHFFSHSNPERTRQSLLLFSSLFSNPTWNKKIQPEVYDGSDEGDVGTCTNKTAIFQAKELRLSNLEINNISTLIKNLDEPYFLSLRKERLTNRDIYRFFKHSNSLGIDICLLSLAHTIAQSGPSLQKEIWINLVDTIQILFESWWFNRDEIISPKPLINGDTLMSELKLDPGPLIGEVLEAVREAQASGEVSDVIEAIGFAESWLSDNYG